MHKLFIYGTLKKGHPNHDQFMRYEKFLGKYRTREPYPLVVANNWYAPVMLHEPGIGKRVIGELYTVNDRQIEVLDRLEMTHKKVGYQRMLIEIQSIDDESMVKAFVYLKDRRSVSCIHSEYLEEYKDTRYIPAHRRKQ